MNLQVKGVSAARATGSPVRDLRVGTNEVFSLAVTVAQHACGVEFLDNSVRRGSAHKCLVYRRIAGVGRGKESVIYRFTVSFL